MICQDGKNRIFKIGDDVYYEFHDRISSVKDDYDIGSIIYDIFKKGMDSCEQFWKVENNKFSGEPNTITS